MPRSEPLEGLKKLNNRRYYIPLRGCPITHYADHYVSTVHANPFSQSQTR